MFSSRPVFKIEQDSKYGLKQRARKGKGREGQRFSQLLWQKVAQNCPLDKQINFLNILHEESSLKNYDKVFFVFSGDLYCDLIQG